MGITQIPLKSQPTFPLFAFHVIQLGGVKKWRDTNLVGTWESAKVSFKKP